VRRRPKSSAGFTLTEVLVSSTLAAIIMAAVLSSFVFIARNLARLSSYQALESESRVALAYLRRDFAAAQGVKSGTTPTDATVTLILPGGDVTYTYDSVAGTLRRQATFGPVLDRIFLHTSSCECTAFSFGYFTTSDAAPTDQVTPTVNVPYSIKQIQVRFTVESPATWSANTRTSYDVASSRFLIRNKTAPNGS
jgi:prepilin-type N-terminal cleavage/methylation domain-containing protein